MKTCETCRWFAPTEKMLVDAGADADGGQCRRRAPTGSGAWPSLTKHHFCGEHENRDIVVGDVLCLPKAYDYRRPLVMVTRLSNDYGYGPNVVWRKVDGTWPAESEWADLECSLSDGDVALADIVTESKT